MKTHRGGLPRFSARSARRGDAGHCETCATQGIPWTKALESRRSGRVCGPSGASERFDDAPHRLQLPSCRTDRIRDLYGSSSAILGIICRKRKLSQNSNINIEGANAAFAPVRLSPLLPVPFCW